MTLESLFTHGYKKFGQLFLSLSFPSFYYSSLYIIDTLYPFFLIFSFLDDSPSLSDIVVEFS